MGLYLGPLVAVRAYNPVSLNTSNRLPRDDFASCPFSNFAARVLATQAAAARALRRRAVPGPYPGRPPLIVAIGAAPPARRGFFGGEQLTPGVATSRHAKRMGCRRQTHTQLLTPSKTRAVCFECAHSFAKRSTTARAALACRDPNRARACGDSAHVQRRRSGCGASFCKRMRAIEAHCSCL